jgi:hypothetical protein
MSAANSHVLSSTGNETALWPAPSLTTMVVGTKIVAGVDVRCPALRGTQPAFK